MSIEIKKLKEYRKLSGTKQNEIASLLGLDQSNFSNIENSRLIPKNIIDVKVDLVEILQTRLKKKAEEITLQYQKYHKELMEAYSELMEAYPELLNEQEANGVRK